MRFLIASALFLNACSACAPRGPAVLPGIPLEIDPSISIFTPDGGGGHACPVAGGVVTARHVMWDEFNKKFLGASWSYQGQRGAAFVVGESQFQDVVVIELSGGEVHYLPMGALPEVGDPVYWFEYDFRTKKNAYRARRRTGSVLRLVGGHIIIDSEPVPGASGTCLINAKGEAVGIVVAAIEADDGGVVGIAAAP